MIIGITIGMTAFVIVSLSLFICTCAHCQPFITFYSSLHSVFLRIFFFCLKIFLSVSALMWVYWQQMHSLYICQKCLYFVTILVILSPERLIIITLLFLTFHAVEMPGVILWLTWSNASLWAVRIILSLGLEISGITLINLDVITLVFNLLELWGAF